MKRGLIDSFDDQANFWELYPQLKVAGPFKELYKKDARSKSKSSKLMWAVALAYDQNSKFYKLPEYGEDNKFTVIGEDYMGDKEFFEKNNDTLEPIVAFYRKLTESPAMRALRAWEEKMEERAAFLKDTKYVLDSVEFDEETGRAIKIPGTAELLDKMLANNAKLFADYKNINERLIKENAEATAKGGAQLSLSDTDDDF